MITIAAMATSTWLAPSRADAAGDHRLSAVNTMAVIAPIGNPDGRNHGQQDDQLPLRGEQVLGLNPFDVARSPLPRLAPEDDR